MKLKIMVYSFLILSNTLFSQVNIGENEMYSSVETYRSLVSKFNFNYEKSIFILVISCSDTHNFKYSVSHTKSETMYEFAHCRYYQKYNDKYVIIRLDNCDIDSFRSPFPFKELDKKTDSIIRTKIYPKTSIISGDYPTMIIRSMYDKKDTTLYNDSGSIPFDMIKLYKVDFDYTDYLSNEMVKSCVEIINSTKFKTRLNIFSFYYDSLYIDFFCFETTNGNKYRFPKKYYNVSNLSEVGFEFEKLDSLIKLPDSDSLIIIRDDKTFHFPIPY